MIRIYIYVVALLLFAAECVFGQKGLKFGVLFDPTITWFRSDNMNVTPEKAHTGFNLGMSVDHYFANNYAFTTGVSLFNTGGTLKYANRIERFSTKNNIASIAPDSEIKYRIQYVKIPVALKFKTHRIGRYVYFANLGFNPMVRTWAKASFTDENNERYNNASVTKEVNLFNAGWFFGGGGSYSLGGDAAFFVGISFMSTFFDTTTMSRDVITSRNLSLSVGVLF